MALSKLTGNIIDSTQSDLNGKFQFNVTSNGAYNIEVKTHKPWGGQILQML